MIFRCFSALAIYYFVAILQTKSTNSLQLPSLQFSSSLQLQPKFTKLYAERKGPADNDFISRFFSKLLPAPEDMGKYNYLDYIYVKQHIHSYRVDTCQMIKAYLNTCIKCLMINFLLYHHYHFQYCFHHHNDNQRHYDLCIFIYRHITYILCMLYMYMFHIYNVYVDRFYANIYTHNLIFIYKFIYVLYKCVYVFIDRAQQINITRHLEIYL